MGMFIVSEIMKYNNNKFTKNIHCRPTEWNGIVAEETEWGIGIEQVANDIGDGESL